MSDIKRGDLYYANLSPVIGSEQDGFRPVLVIQNDRGNAAGCTTIVAVVTGQIEKKKLPTHVHISAPHLPVESVVLTEQLRTIDIRRLGSYIDHLDDRQMKKVDRALTISLDLHTVVWNSEQKGRKKYDRKNNTLYAEKRTGSSDRGRSCKDSSHWKKQSL